MWLEHTGDKWYQMRLRSNLEPNPEEYSNVKIQVFILRETGDLFEDYK